MKRSVVARVAAAVVAAAISGLVAAIAWVPVPLVGVICALGVPIGAVVAALLAPSVVRERSVAVSGIAFGLIAAAIGDVVIAGSMALGSGGSSDPVVGFAFVAMLGLPFAIVTAILLTIPIGIVWARLFRDLWLGFETPG